MDEKNLAVEKLKKEYEDAKDKFGRYEKVLAEPVLTALESFIGQDEEFARAVYQNSQTFGDCLKAVVKDVGSAISDLDVYRRAVRFYFPGAEIEFCMKLHVNPYDLPAAGTGDKAKEFKVISLFDILE